MEALNIELVTSSENKTLFNELSGFEDVHVQLLEPDHFEGELNVAIALVTIGAASVTAVASVLKELIRSKSNIKIKYKGIELEGVPLENLEKTLEELRKEP